jgi:3-methylcrotonyl-CoA carboxylase alpha subunit
LKKLLIANRGEIACRIAATARRMGVKTVAVYSQADENAKHVAYCDEAYYLGPSEARHSYLNVDAILEVARKSGADALHPGYGFLSENQELATACLDNRIVFVGPPADSIALMGDKASAKRIAAAHDVPLVPGYFGQDQSNETLFAQAKTIGFPVMLKATRGGGGRGMRVVNSPEQFMAMIETCRREALSSFGDDTLMVERYLRRPRHVEIQIFADRHGNVVYLFERDCSIQRRHQKVVEESPAPGLSAELRVRLGEAAVRLARAVGYVGAGTVEFIVDETNEFYFLEMNTRLQVEHGVTEMVTGLDLVGWQIQVARGLPLPLKQSEISTQGHCFEVRLCAERPQKKFLPAVGLIQAFELPQHDEFQGFDVRIDSGVRAQDSVTPFYDSMIAKVMVLAANREQACLKMRNVLRRISVDGVHTNREFLESVFSHPEFIAGDVHTGFLEQHLDALLNPTEAKETND